MPQIRDIFHIHIMSYVVAQIHQNDLSFFMLIQVVYFPGRFRHCCVPPVACEAHFPNNDEKQPITLFHGFDIGFN